MTFKEVVHKNMKVVKGVGSVNALESYLKGEDVEKPPEINPASLKADKNVWSITGWAEGTRTIKRVLLVSSLDKEDFKKHVEEFKNIVPPGQLRDVERFVTYMKDEGEDVEVVEKAGLQDLTG